MVIDSVALRVKDLDKELDFYEKELGLEKMQSYSDEGLGIIELGKKNGIAFLKLKHDPSAKAPDLDSAGLYHYAILIPSRKSLASTYLALGMSGVYFEGFADHGVSEALYLRDPEGNGIEIYADRPRERWSFVDGKLRMASDPIDFDSLMLELSKEERARPRPFPEGAEVGHVHLKVTDLNKSVEFYKTKLGLDMMETVFGAAFLSYEGYHHHVGLNTWESLGGSKMEECNTGLEYFSLRVPRDHPNKEHAKGYLVDPDGIKIKFSEE